MTTPIIGINAKVELQATLGSPLTVSAITLASPGVATSTAHGLSNGAVGYFTVTSGMPQADGQAVRVAGVTTDTFQLEGLNTTNYDAFVSGTFTKIATFETLDQATKVNMADAAPATLDGSTLMDGDLPVTIYGRRPASTGTIDCWFKPGGTAEGLIAAASSTNSPLVFRFSYSGGTKHSIGNMHVTGGEGFTLDAGALSAVTVSVTRLRKLLHYAS